MNRFRSPRRRRASVPACEGSNAQLLSSAPWLDHTLDGSRCGRSPNSPGCPKAENANRHPAGCSACGIGLDGAVQRRCKSLCHRCRSSGFPAGGPLKAGDILVTNFNSSSNLQGTGSTLVSISPAANNPCSTRGQRDRLVLGAGGLEARLRDRGEYTATYDSNGNLESVGNGSLTILNRFGHVAATLTDPNLIAGPWGVAINDQGNRAQVFVTNVLNGTVTRIDLKVPIKGDKIAVQDMVQVGSGFSQRADPAVFWLGPTGLAFNAKTDCSTLPQPRTMQSSPSRTRRRRAASPVPAR